MTSGKDGLLGYCAIPNNTNEEHQRHRHHLKQLVPIMRNFRHALNGNRTQKNFFQNLCLVIILNIQNYSNFLRLDPSPPHHGTISNRIHGPQPEDIISPLHRRKTVQRSATTRAPPMRTPSITERTILPRIAALGYKQAKNKH